jgi:hypothetical protein
MKISPPISRGACVIKVKSMQICLKNYCVLPTGSIKSHTPMIMPTNYLNFYDLKWINLPSTSTLKQNDLDI